MTALKAVETGGRVVYSTCSISCEENDKVIEQVLAATEKEQKTRPPWKTELGLGSEKGWKTDEKQEDDILNKLSEETKYGRIVLPDHPGGGSWGPYFCVITKTISKV